MGTRLNALSKKEARIATQPNRHRMSRSSMPRFLPSWDAVDCDTVYAARTRSLSCPGYYPRRWMRCSANRNTPAKTSLAKAAGSRVISGRLSLARRTNSDGLDDALAPTNDSTTWQWRGDPGDWRLAASAGVILPFRRRYQPLPRCHQAQGRHCHLSSDPNRCGDGNPTSTAPMRSR